MDVTVSENCVELFSGATVSENCVELFSGVTVSENCVDLFSGATVSENCVELLTQKFMRNVHRSISPWPLFSSLLVESLSLRAVT